MIVQRKIIGFHQDEAQEWVADLACGHKQHVRHTPLWLNRPWIISPWTTPTQVDAALTLGFYHPCGRRATPRTLKGCVDTWGPCPILNAGGYPAWFAVSCLRF